MIFFLSMETEYLTTAEAAERLEVTPGHIRKMIMRGQINDTKKFGRDTQVPVSEVERLKQLDRKAGRPKKENK